MPAWDLSRACVTPGGATRSRTLRRLFSAESAWRKRRAGPVIRDSRMGFLSVKEMSTRIIICELEGSSMWWKKKIGVQQPHSIHISMWLRTIQSSLVKLIVSSDVSLVVLKPWKLPVWSNKLCHSADRKKPWALQVSKNEGKEGR